MTRSAGGWLPSYVLLALIWGGSFAFMKIELTALTPLGVSFSRIALGALTLIAISLVLRSKLPPRALWPRIIIYAFLVTTIPWTAFAFAEAHISSALAGILNGITPLMTLLAILIAFPEERPTRQRMLGLAIGFLGILVVVGVWQGLGSSTMLGVVSCLVAVACYGISYPYARRYLTGGPRAADLPPLSLATSVLIVGTILTAPFAIVTGLVTAPLTWPVIVSALALGCLGSGIAYILNFRVMARADATTASTVTYIPPIIAVVIGALFLDEHLTWNQPLGAVLVLLGAAIAQGVLRFPPRQPVKRTL